MAGLDIDLCIFGNPTPFIFSQPHQTTLQSQHHCASPVFWPVIPRSSIPQLSGVSGFKGPVLLTAVGFEHTLVADSAHQLFGFGSNVHNQLGLGVSADGRSVRRNVALPLYADLFPHSDFVSVVLSHRSPAGHHPHIK